MTNKDNIEYWINLAEKDINTADHLFESKDYHWSLYIAHISLEKMLKAFYVFKINELPPKTHDLIKLSQKAGLELDSDKLILYHKINEFNIEARYSDKKLSFFKLADHDFTDKFLLIIKDEITWIKSKIEL